MATVSKEIADKIVEGNGYYCEEDPLCVRIVEYTDMGGKQAYGIEYEHQRGKYVESMYVRNPKVYYQHDDF